MIEVEYGREIFAFARFWPNGLSKAGNTAKESIAAMLKTESE